MKVLFLHFPKDSDQIGGVELPNYFANLGYEVYSVFNKGDRKFRNKYLGNFEIQDVSEEFLKNNDYDVVICKSSAYQTYGSAYTSNSTNPVKFNLMPMGINRNKNGIDYNFGESEIIKAPVRSMQHVLQTYKDWDSRKDQLIIGASIGTDKNQLEFLNFVDKADIFDWKILFAGPIKSPGYMQKMKKIMDKKSICYEYLGYIPREELAVHLQESKLSVLTTDPRPLQPFDPGPRIIYESVRAGTPCFVNDLVLVYPDAEKFCFRYSNGDLESFKSAMQKLKETNLDGLSKKLYEFGEAHFTIENACDEIHKKVLSVLQKRSNNV